MLAIRCKSLGPILPTGRLWITLSTVPMSCPVISINLNPQKQQLLCNRWQYEARCHLLATDTWQRFLLHLDRCLGAWCVPSATHVPGLYWSQNKVLGTRVFATLLFEISLYINTIPQLAEGIMANLWRDFWIRETGTGQQVAHLHNRYMMMIVYKRPRLIHPEDKNCNVCSNMGIIHSSRQPKPKSQFNAINASCKCHRTRLLYQYWKSKL